MTKEKQLEIYKKELKACDEKISNYKQSFKDRIIEILNTNYAQILQGFEIEYNIHLESELSTKDKYDEATIRMNFWNNKISKYNGELYFYVYSNGMILHNYSSWSNIDPIEDKLCVIVLNCVNKFLNDNDMRKEIVEICIDYASEKTRVLLDERNEVGNECWSLQRQIDNEKKEKEKQEILNSIKVGDVYWYRNRNSRDKGFERFVEIEKITPKSVNVSTSNSLSSLHYGYVEHHRYVLDDFIHDIRCGLATKPRMVEELDLSDITAIIINNSKEFFGTFSIRNGQRNNEENTYSFDIVEYDENWNEKETKHYIYTLKELQDIINNKLEESGIEECKNIVSSYGLSYQYVLNKENKENK